MVTRLSVCEALRVAGYNAEWYREALAASPTRWETAYILRTANWMAERGLKESTGRALCAHGLLGKRHPGIHTWDDECSHRWLDHARLFLRDGRPVILLAQVYEDVSGPGSHNRGDFAHLEVRDAARAYGDKFGLVTVIDDEADRIYPATNAVPYRWERQS